MIFKNFLPFWSIPILLFFSIGTVWLRLHIIRMTYSIDQVGREIQLARQEKELLQVKLASLRSPKRLETLARTQFKLSQPRMEQVIHLKKQVKK